MSRSISHLNGKDPNFFIIGGPKTGTTAMAHYLIQHPNVFITNPKEPFYWCQDFPESKDLHGMHSLDSYRKLYSSAKPSKHLARGEGSTTYLQSHRAIADIMAFNPDARIIVMLRNPSEVVHAMHGELLRHYIEDETCFESAWRLQEARAKGEFLPAKPRMPQQLQYRELGCYAPQLARVLKHVPRAQLKIIIFDDFAKDTQAEYQKTLRFLDLPDDGRIEFPKVHQAKVHRAAWIGRLYNHPPAVLRWPINRVKRWYLGDHSRLKTMVTNTLSRKIKRPELRDAFAEELRDAFRDDLIETSKLIDRDLTHWSN